MIRDEARLAMNMKRLPRTGDYSTVNNHQTKIQFQPGKSNRTMLAQQVEAIDYRANDGAVADASLV